MIFFGNKGKVVGGETVQGIQCPDCGNSQFIAYGVLNYFHLYWIPTFLTSKNVGIECVHCKRTLVDDEIPSHLIEQVKSGVFTTANTLPMFSGLIIIGLLAMFLTYSIQQDNAREATYIAQPSVNDYYVVDFTKIFSDIDPEYKYGLMRITSVTSTEVEMKVSKMAYNMASGVRQDIRDGKAAADSYYDNETIYFELGELLELDNAGAISSVER